MKFYNSKEVIELTGITPRNLKFWVHEFNLKTIKKGRENLFNEQTLWKLKIIKYFSNNKFFTNKLLSLYLKKISNSLTSDDNDFQELNKFMNKLTEFESEFHKSNIFLSLIFADKQIALDSDVSQDDHSDSLSAICESQNIVREYSASPLSVELL